MILTLAALALIAALHFGLFHVASPRRQAQRVIARKRQPQTGPDRRI